MTISSFHLFNFGEKERREEGEEESRVRVSAENFSRSQSRFVAERNGDEELLQPNKRDESERSSFASEADALDRLREEGDQQGLGQLPRQVHPNELHRSPPPRLLRWNDLLLPRCAAGGAPPPRAPAARRPLITSLLRVGPSVQVIPWSFPYDGVL